MKYFRHLIPSTSDPDILTSIMQFGGDGYYVFFNTLEILGKEECIDEPLVIDKRALQTFYPGIRPSKLWKILEYFSLKSRLKVEQKCDGTVEIFCSKFSTISSDYTRKVRTRHGYMSEKCRDENKIKIKIKKDLLPISLHQGDDSRRTFSQAKKNGESMTESISMKVRGHAWEITPGAWEVLYSTGEDPARVLYRLTRCKAHVQDSEAFFRSAIRDGWCLRPCKDEEDKSRKVEDWIDNFYATYGGHLGNDDTGETSTPAPTVGSNSDAIGGSGDVGDWEVGEQG